jgi:hypothetical protein
MPTKTSTSNKKGGRGSQDAKYSFAPSPKDDQKCAPGVKFDPNANTCFTLTQLERLVRAYNKLDSARPIVPRPDLDQTSYKRYLVQELVDRFKGVCDTQACLLRQDFARSADMKDILYHTLRPKGPTYRFKWLSTSDINQVMHQYQVTDPTFIFMGAIPIDFEDIRVPMDFSNKNLFQTLDNMNRDNVHKVGFVFNLDRHDQPGSHWVAMYADLKKKQVYFFDSYGKRPGERIERLMAKLTEWMTKKAQPIRFDKNGNANVQGADVRYNAVRHQFKNSECGVYSVNFIIRNLKGDTFDQITRKPTLDDDINKCRDVYFRFS